MIDLKYNLHSEVSIKFVNNFEDVLYLASLLWILLPTSPHEIIVVTRRSISFHNGRSKRLLIGPFWSNHLDYVYLEKMSFMIGSHTDNLHTRKRFSTSSLSTFLVINDSPVSLIFTAHL